LLEGWRAASGPEKAAPGAGGATPPSVPAAADGVWLRRGWVDGQRPSGVEEDQGEENDGRRPWLAAR
jgi:hypothetical protein